MAAAPLKGTTMTPSTILHIVEIGIVILLLVQCALFFETRAHATNIAKTVERVGAVEVTAADLQTQVLAQSRKVNELFGHATPGQQRPLIEPLPRTSEAAPPMRGTPKPGPSYDPKAK
jgi:hypothetical protein